MSRLVKCDCINLNGSSFVYGIPSSGCIPAGTKILPQKPSDAEGAKNEALTILESANQYSLRMRTYSKKQAEVEMETARQDGYEKGFEEGISSGLTKGQQEGYQEGFARGQEAGRAQTIAQNEQTLAQLVELIHRLDMEKAAILKMHEQSMINLALEIARKVVGDQLTQSNQGFINIFQNAVKGLRKQKVVQLSVSLHEATFATTNSEYLLSLIQDCEQIEINVLEDAPQGTCIIDTEDLRIDASACIQLDFMECAVTAAARA